MRYRFGIIVPFLPMLNIMCNFYDDFTLESNMLLVAVDAVCVLLHFPDYFVVHSFFPFGGSFFFFFLLFAILFLAHLSFMTEQ